MVKSESPILAVKVRSRRISIKILTTWQSAEDIASKFRQSLSQEPQFIGYHRYEDDARLTLVEFNIAAEEENKFYSFIENFCERKGVIFEKPNLPRPKEKIQEVCARAQRAVDKSQKEADRVDTGNVEKETILKRLNIDLGVLHALSWVLNEEGIGQIAPA